MSQSSYSGSGGVSPPVMTVTRTVTGSPETEYINSIVVTQDGIIPQTWTWEFDGSHLTDDVATALGWAATQWGSDQPWLDPTKTYTVSAES
jgi:hypothetical protein